MESRKVPVENTELTKEEKEAVLRALGYYQIHLFDQITQSVEGKNGSESESRLVTMAIKKIHKTLEMFRPT